MGWLLGLLCFFLSTLLLTHRIPHTRTPTTDLSVFLGEEHKGHVYMGGGAFRFFGINVYQVALYIDAARAAASPRLRPFAGQSRAELQGNQSFYDAMMTPEVRTYVLWVAGCLGGGLVAVVLACR